MARAIFTTPESIDFTADKAHGNRIHVFLPITRKNVYYVRRLIRRYSRKGYHVHAAINHNGRLVSNVFGSDIYAQAAKHEQTRATERKTVKETVNQLAYTIVFAQDQETVSACDAIREKHNNYATSECIEELVQYLANWDYGNESEHDQVTIRREIDSYSTVYQCGEYVLIVGPTGIYYALYRLV